MELKKQQQKLVKNLNQLQNLLQNNIKYKNYLNI